MSRCTRDMDIVKKKNKKIISTDSYKVLLDLISEI